MNGIYRHAGAAGDDRQGDVVGHPHVHFCNIGNFCIFARNLRLLVLLNPPPFRFDHLTGTDVCSKPVAGMASPVPLQPDHGADYD